MPADDENKEKKRGTVEDGHLKDYGVEYAVSSRSTCVGCQVKLEEGEVRIKKTVSAKVLCYHVDCFVKLREKLGYFESGKLLQGYESLSEEDKKMVADALPSITDETALEKVKNEDSDEIEKKIKEQTNKLYKLRDELQETISKKVLELILVDNDQELQEGLDALLDQVSDMIMFGVLEPCSKCEEGQLVFSNVGYKCTGSLSAWVACDNVEREPERGQPQLARILKTIREFMTENVAGVSKRVIRYMPPSGTKYDFAGSSRIEKLKVKRPREMQRDRLPLYCMEFVILGESREDTKELKMAIVRMGGRVVDEIHEKTTAIISNPNEVARLSGEMQQAKNNRKPVVSKEFVETVEQQMGGAVEYLQSHYICNWDINPIEVSCQRSRSS